jgi:hypothetical protein
VGVPLALGPALTATCDLLRLLVGSGPGPREGPRAPHAALVYLLSGLSAASHLSNLWLAEGAWAGHGVYHLLLLKYVAGSADLVLVPVVVMLGYREVRDGVSVIYRGKSMRQREQEEKDRNKEWMKSMGE